MKLLLCQPWHATAGRAFQPIITAGIMVLLAGILLLCWPTPGKEATPVAAATMPPAPQMFLQVGGPFGQLAVSPDGKYLAEGDSHAVVLWDLATGVIVQRFPCRFNLTFRGFRCHFSADSRRLFISGLRQPLIWNLIEKRLETISQPGEVVWLTDDGTKYWSVSRPDTFTDWNTPLTFTRYNRASGKAECTMSSTIGPYHTWKLSPDCSILINTSATESITINKRKSYFREVSDLAAGKLLGHLDPTGMEINFDCLAFSADSRYCAARCFAENSLDNSINIFDVHTGAVVKKLTGGPLFCLDALAFNRDGTQLAMAGNAGHSDDHNEMIVVWDIASGQILHKFTGCTIPAHSTRAVIDIAFSPDGKQLWGSITGDSLKCWNLATETVCNTLTPSLTPSTVHAAMTPDARYLALGAADGFSLWDLKQGIPLRQYLSKERLNLGWPHDCMSVSSDGSQVLATVTRPFKIIAWDTVKGTISETPTSPYNEAVAFNADQQRAVSTTVKEKTAAPSTPTNSITDYYQTTLNVWDTHGWRLLQSFPVDLVPELIFSHDGSTIAWLGVNDAKASGGITLCRLASGQRTFHIFLTMDSGVELWFPAFSWDDKLINVDRVEKGHHTLLQLSSSTGEVMHEYPLPKNIRSHGEVLDDTHIISHSDKAIVVYDLKHALTKEIPLPDVPDFFQASPGGVVLSGSWISPDKYDIWQRTDILTAPNPRPRATIHIFSKGQWLITTPDGYFDCSPEMTKVIRWIDRGENYPYEKFAPQYHRPEMVRKALGG